MNRASISVYILRYKSCHNFVRDHSVSHDSKILVFYKTPTPQRERSKKVKIQPLSPLSIDRG